ncbi:hypothetical protein ACFUP3_20010 [Bacillus paralicheniformis]|uniref:hypothetical protein n=1 Tax=Bacillus paralicheniformis TaxID=1648923 RepID=UPI003628AE12
MVIKMDNVKIVFSCIIIGLSLVALFFSLYNWRVAKIQHKNAFIHIYYFFESLEEDVKTIKFAFRAVHLGETHLYLESYNKSFEERKKIIDSKLNRVKEDLVKEIKIAFKDRESIFQCIIKMENSLYDLEHYMPEDEDDIHVWEASINSIERNVNLISDILKKYKEKL